MKPTRRGFLKGLAGSLAILAMASPVVIRRKLDDLALVEEPQPIVELVESKTVIPSEFYFRSGWVEGYLADHDEKYAAYLKREGILTAIEQVERYAAEGVYA